MTNDPGSASVQHHVLFASPMSPEPPSRSPVNHRMPRVHALLIAAVAMTACTATAGRSGLSTVGGVRLSSARPSNGFVAELAGRVPVDTTVPAASGRLSLTFRSHEHFEFDLILRDGGASPWVAASIVRVGVAEPVATIVTGVELRGAYAQLRGTGVLPSQDAGPTLLERLRSAPGDYQVRVTSTAEELILTGPLVAR